MGKVYSRDLARQQQISVSKFDQEIHKGNKNVDSLPIDLPELSEISQGGGGTSLINEVQGEMPADWTMSMLKDRSQLDVLKRPNDFTGGFLGKRHTGRPKRKWSASYSIAYFPRRETPETKRDHLINVRRNRMSQFLFRHG